MNWSEVIAKLVMEKLRIKLLSSIGGIEAKLQHFVGRNNSGLADTDYNGAREKKRRPIADNCVDYFLARTFQYQRSKWVTFQS